MDRQRLGCCRSDFQYGLCFVNTDVLAISETHVIAAEVIIMGLVVALSYRLVTLQASVLQLCFQRIFA
jgi:hypothetical protein